MPNREQKRGTNERNADRQRNRQMDQGAEKKRTGNGGRTANKAQRNRGE